LSKYVQYHLGLLAKIEQIAGFWGEKAAMKPKQFVIMGISAIVVIFLGVATLVEALLTDGLVGLYHFDGDANDGSSNGNGAVVEGATLIPS
jgi:hypothetical protein